MPIDLHVSRWLPGALMLAITGTAHGGGLSVTVKSGTGDPLAAAVITAVPVTGTYPEPVVAEARDAIVVMDQVNKEFVPLIKPVFVGSSVSFPNKDNIRHQVYSFSPAKRFELPLYKGTPAQPVLFDKPGVVTLGCNIHDWMIGYIYVSETPWFTQTDTNGDAAFPSLPPGQYRISVWYPDAVAPQEDTSREITVDNKTARFDWIVQIKRRELRPRRAPVPAGGGYR